MILPMKDEPAIIDINAENRPSSFSIQRDGKTITLTNGEVYAATKAQLHRMAKDALRYYAKESSTDQTDEKLRLLEDNIVRSEIGEITQGILKLAYDGINEKREGNALFR